MLRFFAEMGVSSNADPATVATLSGLSKCSFALRVIGEVRYRVFFPLLSRVTVEITCRIREPGTVDLIAVGATTLAFDASPKSGKFNGTSFGRRVV
jgi:hypothetical protein